MADLTQLSDSDLQEELERRRQERLATELRERQETNASIAPHLRSLVPLLTHERGSCHHRYTPCNATISYRNGVPYCTLCALLNLLAETEEDEDPVIPDSWEILVSVQIQREGGE